LELRCTEEGTYNGSATAYRTMPGPTPSKRRSTSAKLRIWTGAMPASRTAPQASDTSDMTDRRQIDPREFAQKAAYVKMGLQILSQAQMTILLSSLPGEFAAQHAEVPTLRL
jgi:hypothetical protein